jgi:predicted RND superfamily exporter protein
MAAPVVWACVADAVGFGALISANVGPVRDFGLMMGLGSLMVLLSVFLVLPGLALFGGVGSEPRRAWGERALDANLTAITTLVYRRPGWLGAFALFVSLVSIWGLRWLQVETDFTRNFRQDTPIVRSYDVIESQLEGAGVIDVLVPAPRQLTWDFMRKVLVMENDLRKNVVVETPAGSEPGLTKVMSIADVVVSLSPRHPDRVRWTRMRNAYITSALRTMRNKIPEFYDALYAPNPAVDDQSVYRVMLRAKERQPASEKQKIVTQVQAIATRHFSEAGTTGCFSLLTGLIHSILCDQWKSVGLGMIGVFLVMIVATRDLRLAMIAMVPTVIPILMVTGLMGWLGWKLNLGGVILAGVSMALSIDCSIHYLLTYKRSLADGRTPMRALASAQQMVGRAMVFSTVALILGFAALATSQLVPSYYFGSLVSMTMLSGLFGNLIWLPLLLRLTQGRQPAVADVLTATLCR